MQNTAVKTPEPRRYKKRVGSTIFEVGVYFSTTSRETMNDKIRRLIKNEAAGGQAVKR